MENNNSLPELSTEEIRVLGSLIEKSVVTPDYYPMTLNALTTACNQKSSRNPVVDYDEETVVLALNSLKAMSLVATAVGGSNRAVKYKHNFLTLYPMSEGELAILCLLFLRGPQTMGELKSNSGRLHEFHSLEAVKEALQKLISTEISFVKELPRHSGQKEQRYMHTFMQFNEEDFVFETPEPSKRYVYDLEARVQMLEAELSELKIKLNQLYKELNG
jgi:uncharacterized protein YceH (UPF0502 family)